MDGRMNGTSWWHGTRLVDYLISFVLAAFCVYTHNKYYFTSGTQVIAMIHVSTHLPHIGILVTAWERPPCMTLNQRNGGQSWRESLHEILLCKQMPKIRAWERQGPLSIQYHTKDVRAERLNRAKDESTALH